MRMALLPSTAAAVDVASVPTLIEPLLFKVKLAESASKNIAPPLLASPLAKALPTELMVDDAPAVIEIVSTDAANAP